MECVDDLGRHVLRRCPPGGNRGVLSQCWRAAQVKVAACGAGELVDAEDVLGLDGPCTHIPVCAGEGRRPARRWSPGFALCEHTRSW